MTVQCLASSYSSFSIEDGVTDIKGNSLHYYQYQALDNLDQNQEIDNLDQKNCNNSSSKDNINITYKLNYGNVLTKICMYSFATIVVGCGSYLFWDAFNNQPFDVPNYQNVQNISNYQNVSNHQLNCICKQVDTTCFGLKTWVDDEGDRHFQQYTYPCMQAICKGVCKDVSRVTNYGNVIAGAGLIIGGFLFICSCTIASNNSRRVIVHPY